MTVPRDLAERLRRAYARLPEDRQQQIKKKMQTAHQQISARLAAAEPPGGDSAGEITEGLAHAFTVLFPEQAQPLTQAEAKPEITPPVGSGGEIYGFGKYEQLDIGWVEAIVVWAETVVGDNFYPFQTAPAVITIPNTAQLVMLGDWGTGNYGNQPSPAVQIANFVNGTLKPEYAIHLGDVYYAGTAQEESSNFLAYWPFGSQGNFALNSNHEMYDGANGYFETLLGDPRFADQNQTSYFALQNDNWILIGLDSAYYSDKWDLYLSGNLDSSESGAQQQLAFLTKTADAAQAAGKKLIILSHHNGLAADGGSQEVLWGQVMSACPGSAAPAYWYWGHQHVGATYPCQGSTSPRCNGHGAIPWGYASELDNPNVNWFEQTPMPGQPPQVMNGFVALQLDGPQLTETFYDQTGNPSWTNCSP